jgi:hypothetical protein
MGIPSSLVSALAQSAIPAFCTRENFYLDGWRQEHGYKGENNSRLSPWLSRACVPLASPESCAEMSVGSQIMVCCTQITIWMATTFDK